MEEEKKESTAKELNTDKKNIAKESNSDDEMSILFPEIEVEGFKIKPWSLGKLVRINPYLEAIFTTLEQKNIQLSIENIESHLKDIYFAAIPQILPIMAISLDCNQEDIEKLPIPNVIRLLFLIFKQNEDSIKNVLSLLRMAV